MTENSAEYNILCKEHEDVVDTMVKTFRDESQECIIKGCEFSKKLASDSNYDTFVPDIKQISTEDTKIYKKTLVWVEKTVQEWNNRINAAFDDVILPFVDLQNSTIREANDEYKETIREAAERRDIKINSVKKRFNFSIDGEKKQKEIAHKTISVNAANANKSLKKFYKRSKMLIQSYPHDPNECSKCPGLREEQDLNEVMDNLGID